MKRKNLEKEVFIIPENEIEDYTKTKGSWKIGKETYVYLDRRLTEGNGGECYDVLVQRKRDSKYFSFSWEYQGGSYYYYEDWEQVFPKEVMKVVW